MGNYSPVNLQTLVATQTSELPYLHHALLTFRPSTADFLTGFTGETDPWMIRSPATNLGLVAALTKDTWRTRLKSMGAVSTDPLWIAVEAFWGQLIPADGTGIREAIRLPDVLYVGRRTRAVATTYTITIATNAAGTIRVRVNPSKHIHAGASPAGALADVTITADGALTVTQLATALAAALTGVAGFAAYASATPAAGVVTVATDVVGQPLLVEVNPSVPGPNVTLAVTTANTPGNYALDLDDLVDAAEYGDHLDPPGRLFWAVTDLQADDVVDLEGMEWAEDQGDTAQHDPPRDYAFFPHSNSGGATLTRGGDLVGNFDPDATDSLSQAASTANGGEGYTRSCVTDHDRWEFPVPALLGRTLGYLPGQVSFTAKVLYGSTAATRITPRDHGDDEALAQDRQFNWYAAYGSRGQYQYGATPAGSFIDRVWLADYCTYWTTRRLLEWMQIKNIVTFTDTDIAGAKSIIASALAELPAVTADSIVVRFKTRAEIDGADISARVYKFYSTFADTSGVINQIGTLAEKSPITLTDG